MNVAYDPNKASGHWAAWIGSLVRQGLDPFHYSGDAAHENNREPLLLDLRLAAGRHTVGTDVAGAFRLAGLPRPRRVTIEWARVVYVCAPSLHEVEALRTVREAGPAAQAAVEAAYLLGGVGAAEDAILELMTGGSL